MSGIYIHIPFCKKKCHYCDFHFSTQYEKYYEEMVGAICNEIELQSSFFEGKGIETIYFGGGTPSLLKIKDLIKIYNTILTNFNCNINEFTVEMNPDDIDKNLLKSYTQIGINRLSVGIQSFKDDVLKLMNRSHNSNQAINCIETAKNIGLENISIDLIYGIPNQNNLYWKNTVKQAIELNVSHISAYCLTIEQNTVFNFWEKKKKIILPQEEEQFKQFHYLINELSKNGILQYEVSNFSKLGFESKHNSSYWSGRPYLGIGPSAHSFKKNKRYWNISNNHKYIIEINKGNIPFEMELLSDYDRFNELILTGLRTTKGVSVKELETIINKKLFIPKINKLINQKRLILKENYLKVPKSKLFQTDGISSELFFIK